MLKMTISYLSHIWWLLSWYYDINLHCANNPQIVYFHFALQNISMHKSSFIIFDKLCLNRPYLILAIYICQIMSVDIYTGVKKSLNVHLSS